jgi:FixJ family two-component response regulator
LEATQRIKTTKKGAQTKIVALTAHALEEERRKILLAGCDDLIRKPYKDNEIFAALTKHLGVRFVYEGEACALVEGASALSVSALAELSPELLNDLNQALVRIDVGAINQAIEAIRVYHPATADALNAAAKELQYSHILDLTEAVYSEINGEAKRWEKR